MSILKKLAGQTALYGLSSIVGRVLNFLLVPFFTALLDLAEFGIYTDLYAYMAFLNVVYLFGMETTYFRFASRSGYNEESTFQTVQGTLILSSFFLSTLIILLAPWLANILNYPGKETWIIILSLILFVDTIVAIPLANLRLQGKAGKFAGIKLINIILTIFLNLFFLVFSNMVYKGEILPSLLPFVKLYYIPGAEIYYILLSNLIANAFQIVLLYKNFTRIRFRISVSYLKPMFVYAYPLMFMGLAGMVNEVIDRNLLKYILPPGFYPHLTNLEALGIYGACYKLSMFMSLAIQAFRYAADPFFFSKAEDKNAPEIFAKVMKYFIITCTLIYIAVSLNLNIFGLFLSQPSYREGLVIVPILLLANLFLGVYYNLSVWYKLTDKTHFGTYITAGGALVTILANVMLIPLFGYVGSALATLICYFSMAAVSYLIGQKYFYVPYNLKSAAFYIGLSSAFILLYFNLTIDNHLFQYAIQFSLVLLYLLIVFLLEKRHFNFKR